MESNLLLYLHLFGVFLHPEKQMRALALPSLLTFLGGYVVIGNDGSEDSGGGEM